MLTLSMLRKVPGWPGDTSDSYRDFHSDECKDLYMDFINIGNISRICREYTYIYTYMYIYICILILMSDARSPICKVLCLVCRLNVL